MSASSEELCQLGFAMKYSWLHQTYSLNQVASNHQYRNQPLLKGSFCRVRQWHGNGNVFLCHFSCSWHSLNRYFLKTSAIAVFSIPNSPSFAILHFTFDMRQKISRDNFTNFKTIKKKHKMYACLLLDFKALSIVIDFVVRLLGKV